MTIMLFRFSNSVVSTNHHHHISFLRRHLTQRIISTATNRKNSLSKSFNSTNPTTTRTSSSTATATIPLPEGTQIQILGARDDFGALKRYILIKHKHTHTPQSSSIISTPIKTSESTSTPLNNPTENPIQLASLYSKRNLLFGTILHETSLPYRTTSRHLLELALNDASHHTHHRPIEGLAKLNGLSTYVRSHLRRLDDWGFGGEAVEEGGAPISLVLVDLHRKMGKGGGGGLGDDEGARVVYDAVRAVADGYGVVGLGTCGEVRECWTRLSWEYANWMGDEVEGEGEGGSEEAGLFLACGGIVERIEYDGDADDEYLREAGGAMAYFTFP